MTPTTLAGIGERSPLDQRGHAKLPWHEPGFSRRMLAEHLDQRHDHASRRFPTIDLHVGWIVDELLSGRPGSVLDLGCGPGLYTQRLATRGCSCRGIDISPASIEHARTAAETGGLPSTYVLGDITTADLGSNHDLAMFLFGELNTFPRPDVPGLLRRVHRSLRPGGRILLEVHTQASVIDAGNEPATWYTSHGGLFASGSHLVLIEHQWSEELGVANTRHYVIEANSGVVNEYGETLSAYTDDDYQVVLTNAGFVDVQLLGDMGAAPHPDMTIIVATAHGPAPIERQLRRH
jgi:SAM-dependent methyltransferase